MLERHPFSFQRAGEIKLLFDLSRENHRVDASDPSNHLSPFANSPRAWRLRSLPFSFYAPSFADFFYANGGRDGDDNDDDDDDYDDDDDDDNDDNGKNSIVILLRSFTRLADLPISTSTA